MKTSIARALLIGLFLGQAQPSQTPAQILDQIGGLIKQLQGLLAAPSGPTIATAAELTAALKIGGTIRLAPGTYLGNFTITKPTDLSGTREAVLTPLDKLTPPLTILASDVTVSGLTVKNGAPDRETVVVGDFNATDAAKQPARVVLDTLAIEAGTAGGHRGIALHGSALTVKNSRITNFWEVGRESQGIWIHNGPGPYTIVDNYIEAAGEGIMVGGSSVKIPTAVPSDILIARNTLYKPDTWRTNGATVKNCLEIKNGRRVVLEDNVCDGNWKNAQDGNTIVLTVRNQEGDTPWVIVDDITVRRNRTVRCKDSFAVSILGYDTSYPSQQTQKILIEGNLFTDAPSGIKVGNGVASDLTIRRNTFPAITGTFLSFYDERATIVKSPITVTGNVIKSGAYGISGTNLTVGMPALNGFATVVTFSGNVIEKTAERTIAWPAGNTLVEPGQLAVLLDPLTFKAKTGTVGY